jgi:hypothetical protein
MKREYMLVAEGNQMTVYRANIKIKINSSVTNTWIEILASNANVAKALLHAQYGRDSVIAVTRKSGQ